MYVFPGKSLNKLIEFQAGGNPVSPELAAYIVRDIAGEVVPSTNIPLVPDDTSAWITVPASAHQLDVDERYRQYRIDVSFTHNGLQFDSYYAYYVVPDLFISHTAEDVRSLLGLSAADLSDDQVNFYRAYIDLASGEYGTDFLNALNGGDMDLAFAAKQLIYWQTILTLFSTVRMSLYKSVESETSKITRLGNASSLDPLESMINDKFALYLSIIQSTSTAVAPVVFIVTTGTDPVTGA